MSKSEGHIDHQESDTDSTDYREVVMRDKFSDHHLNDYKDLMKLRGLRILDTYFIQTQWKMNIDEEWSDDVAYPCIELVDTIGNKVAITLMQDPEGNGGAFVWGLDKFERGKDV
tara:strand:+ start:2312 stop:2653 length:342 start_codon:yes stop_codon:yes gene_type:complete